MKSQNDKKICDFEKIQIKVKQQAKQAHAAQENMIKALKEKVKELEHQVDKQDLKIRKM